MQPKPFAFVLLINLCVPARLVRGEDTVTQLATLLSQQGWQQQGCTVAIIDPVEGDKTRQVTVEKLTQRGADGRPEVTEDNVDDKLRQASMVLSCLYGNSFKGFLTYTQGLMKECQGVYLAMPLMAECVQLVLCKIKQSETMTSHMTSALMYFYEASSAIDDRWMQDVLVTFQIYTDTIDLSVNKFFKSVGEISATEVIDAFNSVGQTLSTLYARIATLMNGRCVPLNEGDIQNDPIMIERIIKRFKPTLKELPKVDQYRNQFVLWLSTLIDDQFNVTIRDRYIAMGFIYDIESKKSKVVQ